jgi:hypothetical protein
MYGRALYARLTSVASRVFTARMMIRRRTAVGITHVLKNSRPVTKKYEQTIPVYYYTIISLCLGDRKTYAIASNMHKRDDDEEPCAGYYVVTIDDVNAYAYYDGITSHTRCVPFASTRFARETQTRRGAFNK